MTSWDSRYAKRQTKMRASEIRELLKLVDQPDIVSFAGGIPDPALFPTEAIQDVCPALVAQSAGAALQYSVSEGFLPLREWLASFMAKIGVPCSADRHITITAGSQQALDYLGKLFLSPGDTLLTTWPTYLGALQAFNAYEPRYAPLPLGSSANITPEAARTEAAACNSRLACGYVTSEFSNPTGESLSLEARNALLDYAASLDVPLIEDGAYQTLRFDGAPVPSLLALDVARHGGDIDQTNTIYCGSFSKVLTPGLRVGWVCAAQPVIARLVLIKQAGDLHCPTLNQMLIRHLAETLFDSQVEKIKSAYRSRRDAMLDALSRHMPPNVHWTKPEGGMFIWLTLPLGTDSAALLAQAIESEKVAFVPGAAFYPDGSGSHTLRLSYSLPAPEVIEVGIARLGRLLRNTLKTA